MFQDRTGFYLIRRECALGRTLFYFSVWGRRGRRIRFFISLR